jgi:hypothetical protein
MTPERAETIALGGLGWLAQDAELLSQFMGWSGADPTRISSEARNPDFLGFVLDFILMSDDMVIRCAEEVNVAAEDIMRARQMLPGGDVPNWT